MAVALLVAMLLVVNKIFGDNYLEHTEGAPEEPVELDEHSDDELNWERDALSKVLRPEVTLSLSSFSKSIREALDEQPLE